MTDYNDGKWHGWNGGECPVAPETMINAIFDDCSGMVDGECERADFFQWEGHLAPVVFRVVKPAPPKPREWFLTGAFLHDTQIEANAWVFRYPKDGPVILVREVLPE
jgi:hypothetical protein